MREASSWERDILAHKQTALVLGAEMEYISINVPNQQMAANNDFHSLSGAPRSKPCLMVLLTTPSLPIVYRSKYQPPAHRQPGLSKWDFFRDTNGKGPVTLPGWELWDVTSLPGMWMKTIGRECWRFSSPDSSSLWKPTLPWNFPERYSVIFKQTLLLAQDNFNCMSVTYNWKNSQLL